MTDLADEVIAAAEEVYDNLGSGLRENPYHKAMINELGRRGISVTTESTFPILYKGVPVARTHPDLIVESDTYNGDPLIIELKARSSPQSQIETYLELADENDQLAFDAGLGISFGSNRVNSYRYNC